MPFPGVQCVLVPGPMGRWVGRRVASAFLPKVSSFRAPERVQGVKVLCSLLLLDVCVGFAGKAL